MEEKTVFATLNSVDCNEHTEKKNGLTYLSWAWAWAEVKKRYPGAQYTIYENANGWNYHTDGRTAWVKTGVTIEGLEHIEYLPVMDNRNNSIAADRLTSFDVNKAIQRSLTKACARHGLGLYIYAGEDLPEDAEPEAQPKTSKTAKPAAKPTADTRKVLPEGVEDSPELLAWLHKEAGSADKVREVLGRHYHCAEAQVRAIIENYNDYRVNNNL